jgi:hypothetical protein
MSKQAEDPDAAKELLRGLDKAHLAMLLITAGTEPRDEWWRELIRAEIKSRKPLPKGVPTG